MVISRTNRLLMREATIDDSEFFLKLINEPAWHKFISNHSIGTLEKASEYVEEKIISSYVKYGFGLWVVEKIEGQVPIGICGLLSRESLENIDIGFAFISDYWGQGFAKEASVKVLEYAKNEIKAEKILAITDPLNSRSVKLLKKLGFVYESKFSHPGSEEVLALYAKT